MVGHMDYRMVKARQELMIREAGKQQGTLVTRSIVRRKMALAISAITLAAAIVAYLAGPALTAHAAGLQGGRHGAAAAATGTVLVR